jgi:hypothetical protein
MAASMDRHRWYVERDIDLGALQRWLKDGAPGALPAPLYCHYLTRSWGEVSADITAANGRDWDGIIKRSTRFTVELEVGFQWGRVVCRRATISPPPGQYLPRISALPASELAYLLEFYVRDLIRHSKLEVPPIRRGLAGVLPQVADAVAAHPEMAPPRAVMAAKLTDSRGRSVDREKAKRWVRQAQREGLLPMAPR